MAFVKVCAKNANCQICCLLITQFLFCLPWRVEKSQYETMESLARAASQLSHHLLTAHGLAIRKRTSVVSGIFQLLGRSILFARHSSYLIDSEHSKENESKVEKCQEIFREAFISLRGSLEEHFSGDLFYASESWRQEEFLVRKIRLLILWPISQCQPK